MHLQAAAAAAAATAAGKIHTLQLYPIAPYLSSSQPKHNTHQFVFRTKLYPQTERGYTCNIHLHLHTNKIPIDPVPDVPHAKFFDDH